MIDELSEREIDIILAALYDYVPDAFLVQKIVDKLLKGGD